MKWMQRPRKSGWYFVKTDEYGTFPVEIEAHKHSVVKGSYVGTVTGITIDTFRLRFGRCRFLGPIPLEEKKP